MENDLSKKQAWKKGDKDRRIKCGSQLDRKLSADILRTNREHEYRVRKIERDNEQPAFILAVCVLTALLLLLVCTKSHAEEVNLSIIADIESSNEPLAYNNGHVGEFQISEGIIDTFNEECHKNDNDCGIIMKLSDMYIPLYAHEMANYFINSKIPQWLDYYGIPDNITTRLIAWNWGIGHLRKWFKNGSKWNKLPYETRNYIKKYFKEMNK